MLGRTALSQLLALGTQCAQPGLSISQSLVATSLEIRSFSGSASEGASSSHYVESVSSESEC